MRKGPLQSHEASCNQSKSSRLQNSSIFRRLDSCCPNNPFMSKTISVFSELSAEARLQNKLRKIQSDSIPNKRMVRLCHQFKEHDDFCTPEESRQSDKESPGSQKQNESLLQRNKSISGSMQFKQTSNPTGSFSLLFSSEAINSKFKVVPKSLSVRLLNCSYSGHSFNSRSTLVDLGNEVQLFKKNFYSSAKCPYFCRLQRFCMGCHSKSGQNSRPMERKSVILAHQYKGANGSILALQLLVPNYRNGHIQLSLDNTTTVAYLNHQGGQNQSSFQP